MSDNNAFDQFIGGELFQDEERVKEILAEIEGSDQGILELSGASKFQNEAIGEIIDRYVAFFTEIATKVEHDELDVDPTLRCEPFYAVSPAIIKALLRGSLHLMLYVEKRTRE